jgi:hypothetical protein
VSRRATSVPSVSQIASRFTLSCPSNPGCVPTSTPDSLYRQWRELQGRVAPVLSVMPQLDVETFRAPIMIAGSFGLYSAQSARDHETARSGSGHSCIVASMIGRRADRMVAQLARSALRGLEATPSCPAVSWRAVWGSGGPCGARPRYQRGGSGFRGGSGRLAWPGCSVQAISSALISGARNMRMVAGLVRCVGRRVAVWAGSAGPTSSMATRGLACDGHGADRSV